MGKRRHRANESDAHEGNLEAISQLADEGTGTQEVEYPLPCCKRHGQKDADNGDHFSDQKTEGK